MKDIKKIVVSPVAPSETDVIWNKGDKLYRVINNKWTLIGGAGINSAEVSVKNTTGTPSATAEIDGNTLKMEFSGLKGETGPQGNSGYQGAAGELEVVNNLTDGGETSALSAEQGKVLKEEITELDQKSKRENSIQLYTESNVYPYIETTDVADGKIYLKSHNEYWYFRPAGYNRTYTNKQFADLLGLSLTTSPLGIPSCIPLDSTMAIVYNLSEDTLKVVDRNSIGAKDILIIGCMNGRIDRINTNVLGSVFAYEESKNKASKYDFIHFSGSASPKFSLSGALGNAKLTIVLPKVTMNIYSSIYKTIQYEVTDGETYTISSYEKLVYNTSSKKIVAVSGNTISVNYIVLLTLSGDAVGGLLAPFYLTEKASVKDVGKVYIDEYFNGKGATNVTKTISNVKAGTKLILNGNATSHAQSPQEVWMQVFYDNKDGDRKILIYQPIGVPFQFPYSTVIEEDTDAISFMFRFGEDETLHINARSCVTMEDIQESRGVVGEMLKSATDIMTFNPYPNVIEKLLQAKRKKPNGNTTSLANTTDVLTLLHFSDIHGSLKNLERIVQFKKEYSEYINDVIHTGDTTATYLEDGNIFNDVKGAESILNVIGNHDAWNRGDTWYNASSLETYNLIMRGVDESKPLVANWGVIQPNNASVNGCCYYYKDYTNANIRLVVLDCMHYDDNQKSWFSEILSDAKNKGLSVVVAQHYPAQKGIDKVDTTFNDYDTELQGFDYSAGAERMDDSAYMAVDEFIANGGEFICWLEGHTHKNFIGLTPTHPNQLQVIIENGGAYDYYNNSSRVEGTKTQDAFNIVAIDRESKLIKLIRIGSEIDRYMRRYGMLCYDYANHHLISSL